MNVGKCADNRKTCEVIQTSAQGVTPLAQIDASLISNVCQRIEFCADSWIGLIKFCFVYEYYEVKNLLFNANSIKNEIVKSTTSMLSQERS